MLPTHKTFSGGNTKGTGRFYSKDMLSSVTHPSATSSSWRHNSAAILTELGDMLNKIPFRIDPTMFSDDEEEVNDKTYLDGDIEEVEEVEESFGAPDFPLEVNDKSSQNPEVNEHVGSSSAKSETSTTNKELCGSSQSSDLIYKRSAMLATTERFSVPKQNDTLEDSNSKRKVNNSNSHQTNSSIKQQQRTMEKLSELPSNNKSTHQKLPLTDSATLVASCNPLERLKLVKSSSAWKKECAGTHTGSNSVNQTGKSRATNTVHQHIKQAANVACRETKQAKNTVCRETKQAANTACPETKQAANAACPETKQAVNTACRKQEPLHASEEVKSNNEAPVSKGSSSKSNDGEDTKRAEKKSLVTDEVITIKGKPYMILTTVGYGGTCKVYSVYDASTKSVFAVKCVNLVSTEKAALDGYKQEIEYLTKLKGSNRVIKMYDYEYSDTELRILLEKGDTDFAHYINNEMKIKPLSPIMIKFYWSQMLEAVAEIHKLGIVHSDLKPGNFLLVAGQLKLIDFGIAALVPSDMTSAIRDTLVGTMNYISPEALTSQANSTLTDSQGRKVIIKIGVKADVWSLGCILYNLVYGYTPFSRIANISNKVFAITNSSHEISYPPTDDPLLLDVLKCCLIRDPKKRASVKELLKHPYLTSEAKQEVPGTPAKSINFQDMLNQIQSLTPGRMSVVTEVLQKMKSSQKK